MPIYEFKCKECRKEFEEWVPIITPTPIPCPSCGTENTERKISACGSIGAGSGSCSSSGFS